MTNQTPREQRAQLFEIDDQDAISPFALYSPSEIAELHAENARLRAQVAELVKALKEIYECGSISQAERIAKAAIAAAERGDK